jgi:hypothetical protein
MAFIDRLLPAPIGGGFEMDDYWVWCGSVVEADGEYHMFAARWPKSLPFFDGYLTYSEIVHAVSPTPEGPYSFSGVVLPARGENHWDGQITHNPTVHLIDGTYCLFYIGSTYRGDQPSHDLVWQQCHDKTRTIASECYPNLRIGVATAPTPVGPWIRKDEPILEPRDGKWDSSVVTNPASCRGYDGSILLYYRTNTPDGLRIGLASAQSVDSEFTRVVDSPVLRLQDGNFVEDPFVWQTGDGFEMLAKDMTGEITGEEHCGIHAHSDDGIEWTVSEPPKAYSRQVSWQDGTETVQGCLERPQLLLTQGVPTHLFAATADGPGGFDNAARTWNMVIPLST